MTQNKEKGSVTFSRGIRVKVSDPFFCMMALIALVLTSAEARSQDADSTRRGISVSGVLFLNYQYGGTRDAGSANRFEIDRAYLTARAATSRRDSIRVTLDVFQQRDDNRDDYYSGWSMRVKYAYFNHDFVRDTGRGVSVFARLGLIPTVVIEQEERFWPRGLSPVAVDLNGYFNSADAGVAVGMTLPDRKGEVYATVVNGSGYTSRETDRYKDFQARLTLTPFSSTSGWLSGLELTPWLSFGARASDFVDGKGTVSPVTDARRKHRFGFLTTYRNHRLALGAHIARRLDVAETADTLQATAPSARDVTGRLMSIFGLWRPFATGTRTSPWSVLARVDDVRPDDALNAALRRYIVGASLDLGPRTSVTFDVQSLFPKSGSVTTPSRTFFLHLIANF